MNGIDARHVAGASPPIPTRTDRAEQPEPEPEPQPEPPT
jgi:hypothetical protein